MRVSAFWKPVIACIVVTPICLFLAVASTGAGHGDYLWAKILFPYTMLSALAFGSITLPFILLAILQFPLYGVGLGIANKKHKASVAVTGLLALHIVAAIMSFVLTNHNFD